MTNPIHRVVTHPEHVCDETTKPKLPWHRGDPVPSFSFRLGVSRLTYKQRRYGRGQSGGQVRDDRRVIYDPARDARRGADVVDAPAPAPAVVDEPAAEAVSGAKKRLRDDDDEESEDD